MGTLLFADDLSLALPPPVTVRPEGRIAAVLSVGRDMLLLQYREMVLRLAPCSVTSALPEQALGLLADREYDVVLLGHTLSAEERAAFGRMVRHDHPHARLVGLASQEPQECELGLFDELLCSDYGPGRLLTTLLRCLA